MSDTVKTPLNKPVHEPSEKYSKFHIKGWINFDPTGKTLADIAEGIDRGDGLLTLLDVIAVEDDVASIGEEEVRECFENILAAKRLLQNHELPEKLVKKLRSALNSETDIPEKTFSRMAGSPVSDLTVSGFDRRQDPAGSAKRVPRGAIIHDLP